MPDLNMDLNELNTATIILLAVFVMALAAVCSIARNTIECLACPLRWTCAGLRCAKNFCSFLCSTGRGEEFSVWDGLEEGI